jgi:hypothetical protein
MTTIPKGDALGRVDPAHIGVGVLPEQNVASVLAAQNLSDARILAPRGGRDSPSRYGSV